jgi:pyruvate/2-oxoglutarate dehydrogenase complex dihydrolipoamide acyltransferase (E2) component
MIREMILPQLSMGMSEATVVEWMVREGDHIERDQPLVSIETEKVVTELPAPYRGYAHLVAKTGETLAVETLIAKIADSEEEYRSLVAGTYAPGSDGVASSEALTVSSAAPGPATEPGDTSGAARRKPASGLARALARERGVDLAKVLGSGPGGRVERSDVIGYAETVAGRAYVMREKAKIPLTGMRAAIAKRMVAAKATAAHTYLFFEIDITKLLATRKTILGDEEELGTRVSLIAFYTRALALACEEVPVCNSTLANDEITIWDNVNVGIAVALPGRGKYDSGLIVPVVRDVQDRGLLQIARETKELVRKARAGELSPQDTSDGTITLSSTDSFLPGGWMVSAPLLNLPQVVGFQPGTPIEKPVVREGQIAVRTMLPCGLTYDHRAMDGEPIGRFVRRLRDLLTDPELMLL